MGSVILNLDDFLQEVAAAGDETGALRAMAAILPPPGPLALVLADLSGKVLSAETFRADISPDGAHCLSDAARTKLDPAMTICTFKMEADGETFDAFGLLAASDSGPGLLSGLLAPGSGDAAAAILAAERPLAACSAAALTAVRTAAALRKAQTENRHLRAEHTTLRAAHGEALLAAIRERDERNVIEANRIALEQFLATAQKANQSKSEFLASMSHEIRTPMTAILGFAEEIIERNDCPETLSAAHTIHRNGEYLLTIINDILDISKLEAGKMSVERIECSPASIINDAAVLMKVRAEAKGLTLAVEYAAPPPDRICTDPTRVKQILVNLLGNAIKFTAKGGVRLVVGLEDRDAPRPKLRFDVIDTGIGIAAEQIERLFQPFVQGGAAINREHGGTGLGLVISKRLAEMLGGDLTVRSEPGCGSVFSVTIETGSLAGAIFTESGPRAIAPRQPAAPARAAIRLSGRILLAEDSPDNQRLVSTILQRAGAEVLVAENGQLAVQRVLETLTPPKSGEPASAIDAILMDVDMPIMNGYEATRRLRKAGYRGPIIALTAHAMAHHIEESLAAGCNAHAIKPIDRDALLTTLAEALGGRSD